MLFTNWQLRFWLKDPPVVPGGEGKGPAVKSPGPRRAWLSWKPAFWSFFTPCPNPETGLSRSSRLGGLMPRPAATTAKSGGRALRRMSAAPPQV